MSSKLVLHTGEHIKTTRQVVATSSWTTCSVLRRLSTCLVVLMCSPVCNTSFDDFRGAPSSKHNIHYDDTLNNEHDAEDAEGRTLFGRSMVTWPSWRVEMPRGGRGSTAGLT